MKTTSLLVVVLLLSAGAASVAVAQVAHNTWTSGAPLPTAVAFPATAVLKHEIYVIGGNLGPGVNSTGFVAEVQIYNPVANTWSTGVSYPTVISSASAAVVKNVLYVFGGTGDLETPTNAVWAYNPKTKTWTGKAAMPTARWGSAAVVEKNIIYVIGGVDVGENRLATVESYNPATNTWTEEAPLLLGANDAVAAGLLATTIVVADGTPASDVVTGDAEGYDAITNTWTALATDPTARVGSCFGSIGPKFYDVGGFLYPTNAAGTVNESFQLSKNKWTTTLALMPQGTMLGGSAVYKGQLYCIGGWASWNGSVLDNVQIYQP